MPLIILPSEKAGRGRGPGTGEGGFLSHSLASPSPGNQLNKFGFVELKAPAFQGAERRGLLIDVKSLAGRC